MHNNNNITEIIKWIYKRFIKKKVVMTELEKKIYESALEIIPELKNKVKEIKTEARYISFPFFCDGVIDKIIYDTKNGKFTKIEYTKGKGNGITFEPSMNEFSAYFDEVEICSFEIPNDT